MIAVIVLVVVLVVVIAWAVVTYNGLIKLRNLVQEAWRQIDVELTRRHDLIGNLVETVKGYAAHERGTLEDVVKARSAAMAPGQSPAQQAESENMLSQALGRLLAIVEAYPDLKANQNFLALQNELTATEDRIASARRYYNATVRDLNTKVETVPSNIIAGVFNIDRAEYFEAVGEQREAPRVDFGQRDAVIPPPSSYAVVGPPRPRPGLPHPRTRPRHPRYRRPAPARRRHPPGPRRTTDRRPPRAPAALTRRRAWSRVHRSVDVRSTARASRPGSTGSTLEPWQTRSPSGDSPRPTRGSTAVDGLDLDIHTGECFALLGPNGAGKTTTVEIAEGFRAARRRRGAASSAPTRRAPASSGATGSASCCSRPAASTCSPRARRSPAPRRPTRTRATSTTCSPRSASTTRPTPASSA